MLPTEHGGWGFLFEPIVIALAAAPSVSALCLSLTALLAFLARQPLKVFLDDRRNRRQVPRTQVARTIAVAYMLAAAGALLVAAAMARQPFWTVGIVVVPLSALTVAYDARGESRRLLPELTGAAALGAVAWAAGLAAGWSRPFALALWASALIRILPAIVTVRERVRQLHGEAADTWKPACAHAGAMLLAAGLAMQQAMPGAVVAIAVYLAARAAWDLRPGAPSTPAMRIGLRELVTGLVAAGAIGALWAVWVSSTGTT